MHACDMTVTSLRGGLSACSVVWLPLKYFFLTFIKFSVQLCKNFFKSFKTHGSYLLIQEPFTLPHLLSGVRF